MKIRPIRIYGRYLRWKAKESRNCNPTTAFCKALADAVVLTGDVYQTLPPDMRLHPDDFCGLTCYTPQPDVKMSELNAYFKKTYRWADASGFGLLVGYQAAPETAPMP